MIISRTPYRVSFFGGGTDYPEWFQEHGGSVLTTTINRYCYISCRFLPPFFDHKSRISWSKVENVESPEEIEHPVVRAVLQHHGIQKGVDINYSGDLPGRSGMGSSSAFTVGLLHSLHAMQGQVISKQALADEAIFVERELLKESVGVQDQIQTAYGGFNRIDIDPNGVYTVRPVTVPQQRLYDLNQHILLFYTGLARYASDVAATKIQAIPNKTETLLKMRDLVDEAIEILDSDRPLTGFGELLDKNWHLKKSISDKIAPKFVDQLYEKALRSGALGGKLLGAGGGGMLMLFVPPENHLSVLEELDELLHIPIEFEKSGTQIIFYDPPRYSRTVLSGKDFVHFENGNGIAHKE